MVGGGGQGEKEQVKVLKYRYKGKHFQGVREWREKEKKRGTNDIQMTDKSKNTGFHE